MIPSLSSKTIDAIPPLRRMELMLVVLALACAAVWLLPSLRMLHGVSLMPLWLHTLVELFSVTVALLLFGVVWNAYSKERSGNIVILGCAALAVGLIDIAHMLSYRGMPDFVTPSGPAKAINFWLAARLIAALSMLTVAIRQPAPFADSRSRYIALGAGLTLTAVVYWLGLFRQHWWPDTFIDGAGLTGFKIVAEWAIISIMAAAAVLLYRRGEMLADFLARPADFIEFAFDLRRVGHEQQVAHPDRRFADAFQDLVGPRDLRIAVVDGQVGGAVNGAHAHDTEQRRADQHENHQAESDGEPGADF